MAFYDVAGGKLGLRATIDQAQDSPFCYIVAPLAAFSLTRTTEVRPDELIRSVGYGMGGNSNRAFETLGLYGFSTNKKDTWKQAIVEAVDNFCPVCLGISWSDLYKRNNKTGNHVIYVTGYEAGTVYARDQQNGHVLISFPMKGSWQSDEFGIGRTVRQCTVSWVGIGFPNRESAVAMIA